MPLATPSPITTAMPVVGQPFLAAAAFQAAITEKQLDQRYSSLLRANPALTGFNSMYLVIRSNVSPERTRWS